MTDRTTVHRLQVATNLHRFIEDQVLPGTGIDRAASGGLSDAIVADLAPKNAALLAERDRLQAEMDAWHKANPARSAEDSRPSTASSCGDRLPGAGAREGAATTKNVDAELALQAGPQLVVPITNARYALNAANARWGSLYDALYGTDAMPEPTAPKRAEKWLALLQPGARRQGHRIRAPRARPLRPLKQGSHLDSTGYRVGDNAVVTLKERPTGRPEEPGAVRRLPGRRQSAPSSVLLSHHGLHLDIRIDRHAPDRQATRRRGRPGGRSRAVDHPRPGRLGGRGRRRRQGAGLRQLAGHPARHADREVSKGGKHDHPRPEPRPRLHRRAARTCAARPLAAVRAQRRPPDDQPGHPVGDGAGDPEGILDAVVTTTIALHDLQGHGANGIRNTRRTGSVYIVKPKMHGPAEVAFASELFGRVESCWPADSTVKLGIMDEERRTSVNLKACIAAAAAAWPSSTPASSTAPATRCTPPCMPARCCRKGDMKTSAWIQAYERSNVLVGPGLRPARQGADRQGHVGHARPDGRDAAAEDRPPEAGANTAWVPSPTAATLHALHYHQVDVFGAEGAGEDRCGTPSATPSSTAC